MTRHTWSPRPSVSRRPAPRLHLEKLEDRTLPAVTVLRNFPEINITQTGLGTPPDTMMAVGPASVVGAVNTAIVLKTKTGGTLDGVAQFSDFFASVATPGDAYTDPQVMYDDQAGRFYLEIIEGNPGFNNTSTLDLAVSKSSNPASLTSNDWIIFPRISIVNEGGTEFPDFPKMGWNNDGVFIVTNQFSSPSTFDHHALLSLNKATLLAGGLSGTFATVSFGDDTDILIPARMHNQATGNLEYLVAANTLYGVSSTSVAVFKLTNYFTSPSIVGFAITVPAYKESPGVPGLTGQIDKRVLSVDWVDNGTTQHMVAAQDIGTPGAGSKNVARWYEFDAPLAGTPSLIPGMEGDINPGPGIRTSYPSIALNPFGAIAMSFLENHDGVESTSMYVTGKLPGEPASHMNTNAVLVQAGALPAPGTMFRGGDYSATEYDPSVPSVFWSANEYKLLPTNTFPQFAFWGTQLAAYTPGGNFAVFGTRDLNNSITVTYNGTFFTALVNGVAATYPAAAFDPDGHIIIRGFEGNNSITVNGTFPAEIRAGNGTTVVHGGNGGNVIYGGNSPAASLTAYAGAGNDVLIGGAGTATLYGGRGHSILIGGSVTGYTYADLVALAASWAAGTITPADVAALKAATTAGVADTLHAGTGGIWGLAAVDIDFIGFRTPPSGHDKKTLL